MVTMTVTDLRKILDLLRACAPDVRVTLHDGCSLSDGVSRVEVTVHRGPRDYSDAHVYVGEREDDSGTGE